MFNNILNTTIVRVINALVTFLILLINARMLGAENLGTIGLILLAITVIQMLNNLGGGSGVVFLIPRYSLKRIIQLAYGWCLISAIIGTLVYMSFRIEPVNYHQHIFFLSLILGIGFVNQNILVGKQMIRTMNLISFIQYIILISVIVLIFYVFKNPGINGYLISIYVSGGIQMIIGTVIIINATRHHKKTETKGLLRSVLRYGFFVQIANLAQFFNYRLGYYFVESYLGRASLGIFEIGNKLADGLWLFPKSIAIVQYSHIANLDKGAGAASITLKLLRFVIVLSAIIAGGLVILPEEFYLKVFGGQYAGLHSIILLLAPGMVFMAASMIFAHHFAGLGKHYINTIGSIIGLVVIIVSCYLLIPHFGLKGGAMAASITYSSSLIYNLIIFQRMTRSPFRCYLFSVEDVRFLKQFLLSLRRGNG